MGIIKDPRLPVTKFHFSSDNVNVDFVDGPFGFVDEFILLAPRVDKSECECQNGSEGMKERE